MNRKPYWPALFHVVIGLIFIFVGATQILPMASNGMPFPFNLFPYVWLGFAIFVTGRSVLIFLRGPGEGASRPADGEYRSPYQKPGFSPPPQAAPSERLRQLDTMRQSGLISEDDYEAKKAEILSDL